MAAVKNVMDVFKVLKKTNCRECNEKTCLAFAAAVFKKDRQLNESPYVDQAVIESLGGNIETLQTMADDQEAGVDALKQEVSQIDLAAAARRTGGVFSDDRLTLKVFGKDFSIDSKGALTTEIHVNPWVVAPLLTYILNCNGLPLSGEWVTFKELESGKPWQGLFGQRCEIPLKKVIDDYTDLLEDLIHIFNGREEKGLYNSDISLTLLPLPKMPMLICYWKPEDGLDSDLHLLFDSTAEKNCSIEGIYSLGTGLVTMFEKLALKHGGQ